MKHATLRSLSGVVRSVVLVSGIFAVSGFCSAQPMNESTDDCVVSQTVPFPSCVTPVTAVERGYAALQQANVLVEEQRLAEAVAILTAQLQVVEALEDYGLRVRLHATLGDAFVKLGDFARADASLTRVAQLWSSAVALRWIRSLPSGAASQLSILRASDAAAGAVFRVADLQRQRTVRKLAPFPKPKEKYPYIDRNDSELTKQQQQARRGYRNKLVELLQKYVTDVVSPWAENQLGALASAQRSYEKVYLVPPFVAPRGWRVAVAASIGSMWWDYADALRNIAFEHDRSAHIEHYEHTYAAFGDAPYDGPMANAKVAFVTCVTLSRQYQVLSPETLACESWLAEHYRSEHQHLDELFPMPTRLPTNPLARNAPATLLEVSSAVYLPSKPNLVLFK